MKKAIIVAAFVPEKYGDAIISDIFTTAALLAP